MLNFTSRNLQQAQQKNRCQEARVEVKNSRFAESLIPGNESRLPVNKSTVGEELPPFEVLLSWLSYVYGKTGEWPLPPVESIKETAGKPGFTASTELVEKIGSNPLEKERAKETRGTFDSARVLKLVSENALTPSSRRIPASPPAYFSTGFSYVNSIYFEEAARIIEEYATYSIQTELLLGCKLALSLIIAWSRFPLFNGMNGRQGRWIILGNIHCTRELKVRTGSFRQYVSELERAGLLQTEKAGNTTLVKPQEIAQLREDCSKLEHTLEPTAVNFWSNRAIQANSTVYRLPDTIKVSSSLPCFNPFRLTVAVPLTTASATLALHNVEEMPEDSNQERPETTYKAGSGKGCQTVKTGGKDQYFIGKDLETESTYFIASSKSFRGLPCYESIHDDVDDVEHSRKIRQEETNNAEHSQSNDIVTNDITDTSLVGTDDKVETKSFDLLPHLGVTLDREQKAKFEFLSEEARFIGYTNRQDGRDALDIQEALKFALNPDLTLQRLEERYEQVKEMWNRGQCHKNPIGLLHWAITRDCDPRGFSANTRFRPTNPKFLGNGNKPSAISSSSSLHLTGENKRSRSRATSGNSRSLHHATFRKRTTYAKQSNVQGHYHGPAEYLEYENSELNYNLYYHPSLQTSPINGESNGNSLPVTKPEAGKEEGGDKEEFLQSILDSDGLITTASADNSSLPSNLSIVSDPAFWEEVKEIDLAGRFRLSKQELELLSSSHLSLVSATDSEGGEEKAKIRQVVVRLRSVLEESRISLTTRSVIQMALRQRLGPGYQLVFTSSC